MKLGTYQAVLFAALGLSACSSLDMQGHDPKEYYAEHPVVNRVETRNETHRVYFVPGTNNLDPSSVQGFMDGLRGVSSSAVEAIQIQMPPEQLRNKQRQLQLSKLIGRQGYDKKLIMTEPSDLLGRDEAKIDIAYASVIPPRCPDWRRSPITTYSNTLQGNIGCASVNNLGQQVADPRDLLRGSSNGHIAPDVQRNSGVLKQYYNVGSPASSGGNSGGSSGGNAANPVSVTPVNN